MPEVIVVGAGPVGLSTALQLARQGIEVDLLERRLTPSDLPRAHVINARTMELFRQWGIAETVREAALPAELATSFVWASAIDGVELATLDYISDIEAEVNSPERLCSCPQDLLEGILLEELEKEPSAQVRFGSEVVDYRATELGAAVAVQAPSGTYDVGAKYIVAADGARSTLRELAGLRQETSTPLGRRLNIYFHADLTEQTRNRPYILWTIMSAAAQGIFISLDGRERWVYSVELAPGETADDYSAERAAALVRLAIGAAGVDPEIRAMLAWDIEMAIAETFARGPLFLVGDAAHQFPPMGGFGMNSGIQDGHNLAWKLAAVLRQGASPKLLDTYDAERRPVAAFNAQQSMANAMAQQEAATMMSDPAVLELMASEDGQEIRSRFAEGVAVQKLEFHSQGQQFGYIYASEAVVSDGTIAPASSIADYRPTASPGARIPHLRFVGADGTKPSSIDLTGRGWLLLAGFDGQAWLDATATADFGPSFAAYVVGGEPGPTTLDEAVRGSFRTAYEIGSRGAVLVRPDGHVAARWSDLVTDPAGELQAVAEAVLGTSPA